MISDIIPFAIGAGAILIFGAGWVIGYKSKKQAPCDTCDHLNQKGGRWKYTCGAKLPQYFDRPPEFCKMYKKREDDAV